MKNEGMLLHSCCAPCSSHCLELLVAQFAVTVWYYNPNVAPREEYEKRRNEQKRLLTLMDAGVAFREGPYEPERFEAFAQGLSECREGGARCEQCFRLRLGETAKLAKEEGFPCFATTLTVSPHKDAAVINQIGTELAKEYGVSFYVADFKKKDGYRRSIEWSKRYGLYRQNYCGCTYAMR